MHAGGGVGDGRNAVTLASINETVAKLLSSVQPVPAAPCPIGLTHSAPTTLAPAAQYQRVIRPETLPLTSAPSMAKTPVPSSIVTTIGISVSNERKRLADSEITNQMYNEPRKGPCLDNVAALLAATRGELESCIEAKGKCADDARVRFHCPVVCGVCTPDSATSAAPIEPLLPSEANPNAFNMSSELPKHAVFLPPEGSWIATPLAERAQHFRRWEVPTPTLRRTLLRNAPFLFAAEMAWLLGYLLSDRVIGNGQDCPPTCASRRAARLLLPRRSLPECTGPAPPTARAEARSAIGSSECSQRKHACRHRDSAHH